jgi:aspartyl-tRNA(Asn)/glutamyl-tRNA(Gln) amidotransferase subunit A
MMTLSNVGPLTRTVDDGARMLDAIARPDPRDWYALPAASLDFGREAELRGIRLGVYFGSTRPALDEEVGSCMRALIARLEHAGAHVEPVELPFEGSYEILLPHWHAGALHLVSSLPEERRGLVDKGLLAAAERGAMLTLPEHYRATFLRQRFGEAMQAALAPFDAVITPTLPVPAFEAGREWPEGSGCESWLQWASYVFPFNLSRQPAASVPVGFTRSKLPIGAQVAGALYEDEKIVAIARAIERLVSR